MCRIRLLYMRVILMGSHFNINGYSRYRVSYFCNLLKNVKTNHDPLLAAVGVALLGGNSISQMLVFLTQKPIFSSISHMRVDLGGNKRLQQVYQPYYVKCGRGSSIAWRQQHQTNVGFSYSKANF